MNKNLQDMKNSIIDGQLLNSILSILPLIIGIVIILDQKEKANKKDGFLTNKESQNLALLAKVIFVFIVLHSIELNYESYDLAKETNQNTSSLKLQIGSSYLSLIVSLIGLYVVLTNYSDSSFQPAEIENSYI